VHQIGFFDSGIGGLTVLHEAVKSLPDEDFIYYADTRNAPYGIKNKDEVRTLVLAASDFLIKKGIKALVVACNTATSIAIEDLRKRYSIPIIGMEPAVKPAVEKNEKRCRRVLVTATPLTLKEEKLRNLIARIDNEKIVDLLPLPGLVTLAEDSHFDGIEVENYLTEQFSPFDLHSYGTVVLGCTHFIYFKKVLRKVLPQEIEILDGNCGTVNNLKRILRSDPDRGNGSGRCEFYRSGMPVSGNEELKKIEHLFSLL
jgi:glutamate racemase